MKRLLLFLFALLMFAQCEPDPYDLIIRNAKIFDGDKMLEGLYDVAINADTLVAIFPTDKNTGTATLEVNAHGLLLAPGFIDTHSHHDRGLEENPSALAVVSQGITSIIVGQDGGSHWPLSNYYKSLSEKPVAVNIGSYSGHNTLREVVLGNNFKRIATQAEIDSMKKMLREDLEAGALGLSTGLEYDPGIYSNRDEVLQLAKELTPSGGRYISHVRSEDRYFWNAINEILNIGREAKVPVQISHIKLAMRGLWGKADSLVKILDQARTQGVDVTADIYPYPYWSSTIRVLFPDRNFNDVKEAAFILKEVTSPEGIVFSHYDPDTTYNGQSFAAIAKREHRDPAQLLVDLIRRLDECDKKKGDCSGSIVATSMDENDIVKLMNWPYTNICSDGSSSGRHPRGFGAFPRVVGRYVHDQHSLSLENALHKMTALAADNLNLSKRGRIQPGYFADLVLLNPDTLHDEATIASPQKLSQGIEHVWVNGLSVFEQGHVTGQRPGRVIYR